MLVNDLKSWTIKIPAIEPWDGHVGSVDELIGKCVDHFLVGLVIAGRWGSGLRWRGHVEAIWHIRGWISSRGSESFNSATRLVDLTKRKKTRNLIFRGQSQYWMTIMILTVVINIGEFKTLSSILWLFTRFARLSAFFVASKRGSDRRSNQFIRRLVKWKLVVVIEAIHFLGQAFDVKSVFLTAKLSTVMRLMLRERGQSYRSPSSERSTRIVASSRLGRSTLRVSRREADR